GGFQHLSIFTGSNAADKFCILDLRLTIDELMRERRLPLQKEIARRVSDASSPAIKQNTMLADEHDSNGGIDSKAHPPHEPKTGIRTLEQIRKTTLTLALSMRAVTMQSGCARPRAQQHPCAEFTPSFTPIRRSPFSDKRADLENGDPRPSIA